MRPDFNCAKKTNQFIFVSYWRTAIYKFLFWQKACLRNYSAQFLCNYNIPLHTTNVEKMQDKHPLLSIVLHHAEGISPTAIARQAGLSVLCVRNLLTGRVASRRSTMEKVISACMLLRAQKSMKTARHDYIIHEKQRLYERTKRVARLKFTRKEIQFIAKQERGDSEVSQL